MASAFLLPHSYGPAVNCQLTPFLPVQRLPCSAKRRVVLCCSGDSCSSSDRRQPLGSKPVEGVWINGRFVENPAEAAPSTAEPSLHRGTASRAFKSESYKSYSTWDRRSRDLSPSLWVNSIEEQDETYLWLDQVPPGKRLAPQEPRRAKRVGYLTGPAAGVPRDRALTGVTRPAAKKPAVKKRKAKAEPSEEPPRQNLSPPSATLAAWFEPVKKPDSPEAAPSAAAPLGVGPVAAGTAASLRRSRGLPLPELPRATPEQHAALKRKRLAELEEERARQKAEAAAELERQRQANLQKRNKFFADIVASHPQAAKPAVRNTSVPKKVALDDSEPSIEDIFRSRAPRSQDTGAQ